jgi:hypothetical protein
MKQLFTFLFSFVLLTATAQQKETPQPDPAKKLLTVDASCGQCKLGLKGKGCNLAVRIDGKSYFVDGSDIDSHGDAHADDGFCNKVRKAEVQGEIVKDKFKATYFHLLPEPAKKEGSN